MKYKMIITDVDGTIGNDRFEISDENKEAMQKAMNAGIKVVLCSGRTPQSLHDYEKQIGINKEGQYGIGFNGAFVYDAFTQEKLFEDGITQETARRLIDILDETKEQALLALYIDSKTMIAQHGLEDILAMYNNNNRVSITYVEKITEEMITQDILNLYCIHDRPTLLKLHEELKEQDLGECTLAFTQENLLEFMPPSMHKAQGIKKLCNHLNIKLSDVVTVGDNYNDIEMIEEAGIGIAVANAVGDLKEKANYITQRDNNNHAMVEVVDYVLELNKRSLAE